jgi:hypothetical protein
MRHEAHGIAKLRSCIVQSRMDTLTTPCYRGYHLSPEVIAHCVWLSFRFSLSFQDVQEMMLEHGGNSCGLEGETR